MENIHLYEEPEFDAETQERLDSQVDRLLKGYDWTLAPLANKSVPSQCPLLHIDRLYVGQNFVRDNQMKIKI